VHWRALSIAFATLVALGLVLAAGMVWRRPTRSESPPRIEHLTLSVNDSSPALAPDGRSVAFVSQRDGRPRIWLKELIGGGETALTEGPDLHPRFSPDGSSLLFVRFEGDVGALIKMPFPGGEPRTLLRDVFDADWSPDGEEIVFVRHDRIASVSGTVVGILAPSTGTTRELGRIEGPHLYQPRWSPDGRRIVLLEVGGERLLVVEVADGGRRDVTPPPPLRSLSTAAWDGPEHLLVLEATRDLPGVSLSAGECLRLGVDGGEVETLFWTPNWGQHLDTDGQRVVFSAGFSRQSIWEGTVGRDGSLGGGRWLTRGASIDRQPAYSPDGDWVVFSSDRSGNLDLWKVATGTGRIARLTDDPGTDWDPAFTAAGDLVWSSDRGGDFQIWTAAADGSAARPITDRAVVATEPVPLGDTDWIAFLSPSLDPAGLWRIRRDGSGLELVRQGRLSLPVAAPGGALLSFLEFAEPDPRVARLRVFDRVQEREALTVDPGPQSLTDLVLPGRPAFWGDDRLAYVGKSERGVLGLVSRFVDAPDSGPVAIAGAGFPLLPETFAFSRDGRRVAVSHLDLQQHLLIVDLRPGRDDAEAD
jgi:Tol biopolymer transport system component